MKCLECGQDIPEEAIPKDERTWQRWWPFLLMMAALVGVSVLFLWIMGFFNFNYRVVRETPSVLTGKQVTVVLEGKEALVLSKDKRLKVVLTPEQAQELLKDRRAVVMLGGKKSVVVLTRKQADDMLNGRPVAVVRRSMVYNNPTYLFIAFGFIGLFIGFYTGFSDKPEWGSSITSTMTFLTALIAGGATGLVLVKATPHELQIAGGTVAMLTAFAVFGGIGGYLLRTRWPLSAEKKRLTNMESHKQLGLAQLQEDHILFTQALKTATDKDKKDLEEMDKRIVQMLEQYGVIKVIEVVTVKEETGEVPSVARIPVPQEAREQVVSVVPTIDVSRAVEVTPPKKRLVPTRRVKKENVVLKNLVRRNEAQVIRIQSAGIDALLEEANRLMKDWQKEQK